MTGGGRGSFTNYVKERPDQIHFVRYSPTWLKHFRFKYGNHTVDDDFHYRSNGSFETNLADLFDKAKGEFGIDHSEWTIIG